MSILFTQYLMPNGRQKETSIEMAPEVEADAKKLINAGFCFECEMLQTGEVSFTCQDKAELEDIAIRLSPNGPPVIEAVKGLIADAMVYLNQRKENRQ